MRLRHLAPAALAVLVAAPPSPLRAQVDTVSAGRVVPARETIQAEVAKSRFRLGPVRLRPSLVIGSLGYNNNVNGASSGASEEATSDYTGTLTGSVKGILPIGSSSYLVGRAAGVYSWYAHSTDRRSIGVDTEVTALYTRPALRLDVSLGSRRQNGVASPEIELLTAEQSAFLSLQGELDVTSKIAVYAEGRGLRPRFDTGGLTPTAAQQVAVLERTETVLGGGLAYKPRERLRFGLGVQRTAARFVLDPDSRDNEGTGIVASIAYERPRVYVNLTGGYRRYTYEGSGAARNSGLFGAFSAGYRLVRNLDVRVTGSRRQTPSVYPGAIAYNEERIGAGLAYTLGRSQPVTISGGVDVGANKYDAVQSGPQVRKDDVTTLRGTLSVPIYRWIRIDVNGTRSVYTSNQPGNDRTVYQIGTSVALGGGELIR